MNARNRLATAVAIPLLGLAGAAHSAPAITAVSQAGPLAKAAPVAHRASAGTARPLDLRPPNFLAPQWQRRLQGPTVDHSLDVPSMDYVVVTPSSEAPNTTLAPAGLGSVFWVFLHPLQAWRVLAPVQPGDEFNTDHQLSMVVNDPMSDCPGFRGTPNVRPICP